MRLALVVLTLLLAGCSRPAENGSVATPTPSGGCAQLLLDVTPASLVVGEVVIFGATVVNGCSTPLRLEAQGCFAEGIDVAILANETRYHLDNAQNAVAEGNRTCDAGATEPVEVPGGLNHTVKLRWNGTFVAGSCPPPDQDCPGRFDAEAQDYEAEAVWAAGNLTARATVHVVRAATEG